jgi:hypothetical protein
MRWVVHVAHIGYNRNTHRNLVGNPERKNSLEKISLNRRIILKWM